MKEIYVVIKEEWSGDSCDYYILRAFESREDAADFIKEVANGPYHEDIDILDDLYVSYWDMENQFSVILRGIRKELR